MVFSRTLDPRDYPGVTIVSEDAGGAVARLREQPGKDIALFGGGGLFRSLLDAGQVDTVEVSLIPVLLGDGIPLLPPPYNKVPLKLTSQKVLAATGTLSLGPRSCREAGAASREPGRGGEEWGMGNGEWRLRNAEW